MATHSSVLAWRIPGTGEPGGLLSLGVAQSQTRLKRLSMHACIGEGNGDPRQCSCLENPRDGGAWLAAVHGVAKIWNNFTFNFHCHALEKEMATHSNVFAWRNPRMVEPGGLPSMGFHRVRHD